MEIDPQIANSPVTKANALRFIARSWDDLQAYLATLTEAQLTQPTDAAGWTVKDHLIHLAVWEDGLRSLLAGGSQREGMGIDEATWLQGNDPINALIQQRHRALSLADVRRVSHESHAKLLAQINTLADADLMRPYRTYDTQTDEEQPVIGWIVGNTFMHYVEHKPWMMAIVETS